MKFKALTLIVGTALLLLLLLSSFPVTAQEENNPPAIVSALATPSTIKSGQYVVFEVTASDPDNDLLTYFWDFGDGTTGNGQQVIHTFNLPAGRIGYNYIVTLTVSDGEEDVIRVLNVKVEDDFFNIRIIDPSADKIFEQNEPIDIRVTLQKNGSFVKTENVQSVKAKIGLQGEELELTAVQGEEGVFSGNYTRKRRVKTEDYVIVKANALINGVLQFTNTAKEISFSPAALRADIQTIPSNLQKGSVLKSIILVLYYPNNEKVTEAQVNAILNEEKLNFEDKGDYFAAENLNIPIEESQSYVVKIERVKDFFGNTLINHTKELMLGAQADLDLQIVNPESNSPIALGQQIVFEIESDFAEKNRIGYEIEIKDLDNNIIKKSTYNASKSLFTANYTIPDNHFKNNITFEAGVKEKGANTYLLKKQMSFPISNNYIIELIETNPDYIKINLFYPDNENKVDLSGFEGTVNVNGKLYSVTFVREGENYKAFVPLPLGQNSIGITLKDEFGNASKKFDFFVSPNLIILAPFIIAGAIIIIIIAGLIAFVLKTRRRKKSKEELHEEKKHLEEELKRLKYRHLKKTISEEDLNKKSEEIKNKIKELDLKLGVKTKESKFEPVKKEETLKDKISSLYSKFSKLTPKGSLSKNEKIKNLEKLINEKYNKMKLIKEEKLNEKEIAEAEGLVESLLPYKERYTIDEIENAVISEGSNKKVARYVAKVLKGRKGNSESKK